MKLLFVITFILPTFCEVNVIKTIKTEEAEKFINGVPVLYDGPAQDEYLIDSLVRFKERGIQELTDSSFEHLTQAATGATTGDWFVLFSSSKCRLCKRMTAALETVACNNRGRSNVARVEIETTG